ncbi:hypothetical protein IIA79_00995 [bacterium]|nr:hypothetical protein [bacterium]
MGIKLMLSNVDVIRRFVFEDQPVTLKQIAAELRRQMLSIKSDEDAEAKFALPVLRSQDYYREANGKWEIIQEKMPEYACLREVLIEQHRLLYEREVKSKVAAKLEAKVASVVLDLGKAKGLKKFGSYWGLVEWTLVNDQAAAVLKEHPDGLTEKELLKQLSESSGIDPEVLILNLKGDKRFVSERKKWLLKELMLKKSADEKKKGLALPDLKDKDVDLILEGSFLETQTAKPEESPVKSEKIARTRLRKALKKQAQQVIEQREDLVPKQEDLAARLSQQQSAAGTDEYGVKSFQRVEPAPKERGLAPKEREEIQQLMSQLLDQETVGVGAPLQSVVNAPLSARKMQDVLRLKYLNYTRDRAIIPNEYHRLLVEILAPTIDDSLLHPACLEGNLAVELFAFLSDRLEGAAWALGDDDSTLEIVQLDGARYKLRTEDPALVEIARDKFIVTQADLISHYLNYRYTGIESDKVLARAAQVVTRLSGYEHAYIVGRDYLSDLPKILGCPPNEDNEVPLRFEFVIGNFTFAEDANVAANYLDQSLKLLAVGGRCGVFVLQGLLSLLKEHALFSEFLQDRAITHFIRLPLIEGRHKVVLVVIEELAVGEQRPTIAAEIRDFKSANALGIALKKGDEAGGQFRLVEPAALDGLIG